MTRAPVLVALLALAPPALAQEADEPTIEELLDATDDIARGTSSDATIEMHVKTKRYERTMSLRAWSQGEEKTLFRILSPAKDAWISTLKVDDNIWNYLPKVDRTMKVPAGMMGGNWMGSHFTNDDLVKESRLSDDFTYEFTSRPGDNELGVYEITLTPREDAAVVWGKVVTRITPDKMPHDVRYYDEDGELVRTMTFEEVREFDGRRVPALMKLLPADKPDEFTEVRYLELEFDVDIPESTFTLQALKP